MKERTSTGISGMHFGHLKVYSLDQNLVEFEALIAYILHTIGYSLLEWKKVINTIIQKKAKGNRVQDLQTINLIEADFNYNNKLLTKEIIKYIE